MTAPCPSLSQGEGVTAPCPSPLEGEGVTAPCPSLSQVEGVSSNQRGLVRIEGETNVPLLDKEGLGEVSHDKNLQPLNRKRPAPQIAS